MEMGGDEGKKVGKMEAKDGVVNFFSNLAQEEAIFLVLVCQINGAFQIFISVRRHKGYCLHYQPGGKKTEIYFHC